MPMSQPRPWKKGAESSCPLSRRAPQLAPALVMGNRGSPKAVRPRLRELGEVRRVHVLDPEAATLDESRNLPGDVTAFEQPVGDRLRPLLPAAYARIGRPTVLEEDELAAGPQDAGDASDRLHDARNRAQGEGADDGIDRTVVQGNALPREAQELDVQLRPASLPLREPNHPGVGFERVDLAHPPRIVVDEVDARAHADLQDPPPSQGDDSRPNLTDGLRIAQDSHEMRVDMISVERHG